MITKGIVFQHENSIDVEPGVVTLIDQSRYLNHGTMTDVTWLQLPGGLRVMSFNGTSSLVDCGATPTLRFTTSFSMESFVYFADVTAERDILGSYNGNTAGYALYLHPTAPSIRFQINDLVNRTLVGNVVPVVNTWYYIVGTYDSEAPLRTIYINGVYDNSDTPAGVPTIATENFRLGSYRGTGGWMNGYTSFNRICGYALTAGQVLNRYENIKHWLGINE